MIFKEIFLVLLAYTGTVGGQAWNTSDILPWESYLQLGDIQRPLGLTLNRSLVSHRHFAIGYLCLHSFMYDEAHQAFDLAIQVDRTFIEPYIGKLLAYKQAIWGYTNALSGQNMTGEIRMMLTQTSTTLSDFQRSLLSTAYKWYPDPSASNTTEGEWEFLSSIANLSRLYPNEIDIRALWALSLLNVADQAQFQSTTESLYMLFARIVLEEAVQKEPNHPGILHYLIHAYDVPRVDIAQQADGYALSYGRLVKTASHAQHMPAHIWMRTGLWSRAVSSDSAAIITSYELCTIKLLNYSIPVPSPHMRWIISRFNTSNLTSLLFDCDRENRAHSLEWLSYTFLQIGDWSNSIALIEDLFVSDNQSTIVPDHYRQFAYRTRARAIIELFFWFPYSNQFINLTQQILNLNVSQIFIPVGSNMQRWYPIWGEAGWRFSECLRLITAGNMNNDSAAIVSDHLKNLEILKPQVESLNKFVSSSISMLISQIYGIQYYMNQSWQGCLDKLNDAVRIEMNLVSDSNTPSLMFIRASELLAMHLRLIYQKLQNQMGKNHVTMLVLNGVNVSIEDFPKRALSLYQSANGSAPNRAINTLGMAQSNSQMGDNTAAQQFYQILLNQMNSSNTANQIFSQTIRNATTNNNNNNNSALTNRSSFLLLMFILFVYYYS